MFSFRERVLLKDFFNDHGWVFDFTNNTFSDFTTNSIGIDIQETYGGSKGSSLCSFIDESNNHLTLKLVEDLLWYYNSQMSDESCVNDDDIKRKADQIQSIVSIKKNQRVHLNETFENTIKSFDDEYIAKQGKIMIEMIQYSPADAIGKAKEFIESCFKHILDIEGVEYNKHDNFSQLRKKTFTLINLDVKNNDYAQSNNEVKKILNSLKQVTDGVNNLRNEKGDGHGKGKNFSELPPRYAKLVVNSAITIVDFIWDTYEHRKKISK